MMPGFDLGFSICGVCHRSQREIPALSRALCMRCEACPCCGSKYRRHDTAKVTLEECLVCGPKERALSRRALLEAQPISLSFWRVFDSSGGAQDVVLYAQARFGPGRGTEQASTRLSESTEMKVMRRTDARYIVYGGSECWPEVVLYVGPTLLDACLELGAMMKESRSGLYHQEKRALEIEARRVRDRLVGRTLWRPGGPVKARGKRSAKKRALEAEPKLFDAADSADAVDAAEAF